MNYNCGLAVSGHIRYGVMAHRAPLETSIATFS